MTESGGRAAGVTVDRLTHPSLGVCLILLCAVSLMEATMHHNFLGARPAMVEGVLNPAAVVREQLGVVRGEYSDTAPDLQARMLVPAIVWAVYSVSPTPWEPPTFLLVEALTIFVSFVAMFGLALRVIGRRLPAMLSVLLMAVYLPLIFAGVFRVGEALLFGIYCGIAWAVLVDSKLLFVAFVLLGATQRPDMAVSGAGFGVLYWLWFRRDFSMPAIITCVIALLSPFVVTWAIATHYHITDYSELTKYLAVKWQWNLRDSRILTLLTLPIVVLALLGRVRFSGTVHLMMLSLVPWLIFCVFFANFSETRHFFQLLAVALIGIAESIDMAMRAPRPSGGVDNDPVTYTAVS